MTKSKAVLAMTLMTISIGSLLTPFAVLAAETCACTKKCMMDCRKGKSKSCTCKACDCAKSKECSKDHCAAKDPSAAKDPTQD